MTSRTSGKSTTSDLLWQTSSGRSCSSFKRAGQASALPTHGGRGPRDSKPRGTSCAVFGAQSMFRSHSLSYERSYPPTVNGRVGRTKGLFVANRPNSGDRTSPSRGSGSRFFQLHVKRCHGKRKPSLAPRCSRPNAQGAKRLVRPGLLRSERERTVALRLFEDENPVNARDEGTFDELVATQDDGRRIRNGTLTDEIGKNARQRRRIVGGCVCAECRQSPRVAA